MKIDKETETILIIVGTFLIGYGAQRLGYAQGVSDAAFVIGEMQRREALAQLPASSTDDTPAPQDDAGFSGWRRQ